MIKKKAVLYARVSTDKEEQEQSLEIQEEIVEKFCSDKGFELLKPHYLEQGKSGTNMRKRPRFILMMKSAGLMPVTSRSSDLYFEDNGLSPLFDIIIVKEASRFSRNQTEALSVLKELKGKGVEVYFIATNTSTVDEDWEFKLGLYFNLSQTESKNLSVRVKLSKRHNAEKGRYAPAVVPFGYKRVYDEDGKRSIVIDEDESKVVKKIFEKYIHVGGHTISRILNEAKSFTKSGKLWSNDKITRLIQNPIYIGSPVVMKSKKTNLTDTKRVATAENERITIENAVDAIISVEEFNNAQTARLSRTTNNHKRGEHKSKTDLFSGKLYCATCGAHYVRHIGEGKKITYMCQTRRKNGVEQCASKGIAFSLVKQGLDESVLQFNGMGNHNQLSLLNESIARLIDKNEEIKERIFAEIDMIEADERKTFIFMRDMDKSSRTYELANDEIETINLKRISLKEQLHLIKDVTIKRLMDKVKLKEVSIKKARTMELNEHDLKLLQLQKVVIDDDWVKYFYAVQAYDEEIEEFNRTFGDIIEPICYKGGELFEEKFQRGYGKLITRAEERELMIEGYEAMEDLVSN